MSTDKPGYWRECHEKAEATNVALRKQIAELINGQNDLLTALKKIKELTQPGQSLSIQTAVDVICDAWNEARTAIERIEQ